MFAFALLLSDYRASRQAPRHNGYRRWRFILIAFISSFPFFFFPTLLDLGPYLGPAYHHTELGHGRLQECRSVPWPYLFALTHSGGPWRQLWWYSHPERVRTGMASLLLLRCRSSSSSFPSPRFSLETLLIHTPVGLRTSLSGLASILQGRDCVLVPFLRSCLRLVRPVAGRAPPRLGAISKKIDINLNRLPFPCRLLASVQPPHYQISCLFNSPPVFKTSISSLTLVFLFLLAFLNFLVPASALRLSLRPSLR
jgi:hypothetical protein